MSSDSGSEASTASIAAPRRRNLVYGYSGTSQKKIKEKRDAASLSIRERTPKLLKSMGPDLTVVVGGVEFYHYIYELCNASPVIDTMLATNMKESNEKRIEFPDKDPEQWLTVSSCFKYTESSTTDKYFKRFFKEMFVERGPRFTKTFKDEACRNLMNWLDFLGMQTMVEKFDYLAAKHLVQDYKEHDVHIVHSDWTAWKLVPAPITHKALKAIVKHDFCDVMIDREMDFDMDLVDKVTDFLLDEDCGDEIWQYMIGNLSFPESLKRLDRMTILNSPTFPAILESAKMMVYAFQDVEIPPFAFSFEEEK